MLLGSKGVWCAVLCSGAAACVRAHLVGVVMGTRSHLCLMVQDGPVSSWKGGCTVLFRQFAEASAYGSWRMLQAADLMAVQEASASGACCLLGLQ